MKDVFETAVVLLLIDRLQVRVRMLCSGRFLIAPMFRAVRAMCDDLF